MFASPTLRGAFATGKPRIGWVHAARCPDVIFAYRGQGFAAQMSISASSEFVVKKGSLARIKTTNTIPKGTVTLRSDLLAKPSNIGACNTASSPLKTQTQTRPALR